MENNPGNLTGKTLGSCTLEKLIGQGGMGVVYLARQTRPSRNVAVKVVIPNLAMSSQVYQEFLARFRREADVIARLEHVNIMPIYEYGEQDSLAYLVMPYLTGGSLRDILAERGALPTHEVITYMHQAAAALDYAHAQGVIHRDLKPANFLLHADGRLILADFGIARIMEGATAGSTLTGTGMLLGTPEYMAPEMARGEPVDYRVDIYELGIVLFQMLSGRLPFTGNTPYAVVAKHVQEPLPSLHQINPTIPVELDEVIRKATAKRREERYTTAQSMAQELLTASRGAMPSSTLQKSDGEYNIPTVISSAQPMLPSSPPSNDMQPIPEPITPPVSQYPASLGKGYTPPPVSAHPTPSPYAPHSTQPPITGNRQQPLLLFVGILLAIVLVIGGILVGLQLNKGTAITPSVGVTTAPNTPQATTSTQATYTTATTATTNPVLTTNSTTPAAVPVGALLYGTSSPGQSCDNNGGVWANYNGVKINCQGTKTTIINTASPASLQGTFLLKIPGKSYPANYVVQVQLQQDTKSSSDFGIYFRNQPGNQQGVYTFLIHPDGTWNTYVYDNNTGAATKLAGGAFGDAHAPATLTVVANGQQFTFYANGMPLGSMTDKTYSTGSAGIAVDQSGTITASNFTLYATPS